MIKAIAFIDTFALSASLFHMKKVFDSDAARDGDGNNRILNLVPLLKDKSWATAKQATARSLNAMAKFNGGVRPEISGLYIEKLMPQGFIPWMRNEKQKTLTFHLPIVTNPGCYLYCGAAALCLPTGQLAAIDTSLNHSAANLGDIPRYHLVIDIKPLAETVPLPTEGNA